jgi:hypothetical protein
MLLASTAILTIATHISTPHPFYMSWLIFLNALGSIISSAYPQHVVLTAFLTSSAPSDPRCLSAARDTLVCDFYCFQ